MKFTVPVPVIPLQTKNVSDMVKELQKFDDARLYDNVLYALISADSGVIKRFEMVAEDFRERFYFFHMTPSEGAETQESILYSVTAHTSQAHTVDSQSDFSILFQHSQAQELKVWDLHQHIESDTYIDSLKGKLVIIGMAGLETDRLSGDFMSDFRKWSHEYRYSLDKYEFALINMDDEPTFKWLTWLQLGRFDSPGIFAINGTEFRRTMLYRNYHIYHANNSTFATISEDFVKSINSGAKRPLYSSWLDAPRNLLNAEHWLNNMMKAYMYAIGLISLLVLPFITIIDCFFPVMGRGPNAKKRRAVQAQKDKKE